MNVWDRSKKTRTVINNAANPQFANQTFPPDTHLFSANVSKRTPKQTKALNANKPHASMLGFE